MKNLQNLFKKLLNKDYSEYITPKFGIIFLFFVACIFFYPLIFQNKVALPVDALVAAHVPWTELRWEEYPAGIPIKNLEITDAFSQFYPWRSLVGEFWREGKVPLWNNYMFSGTPFLATLHSASLYPLNFVYLIFSNITSWNLIVFFQIALALIFMYLFLRELTSDNISSIFGAMAFAFSGYMIAWLEFATGGQAGIWLPLLILLQYKFYKSHKLIFLFIVPLIIFMILTAGDFQVPFYSLSVYVLFALFLAVNSTEKIKTIFYYFLSLIAGFFLSLAQWLPTLELFSRSIRTNDPYIKEYFFGIFHWEKIVNFIWPDFFGNVVTGNYWGKFGYHEYLAFVGSVCLALFGFWLFTKKSKVELFFFGLFVVALMFLFPTPLAFLPFKLDIPGLGTSSASRILYLVGFFLPVLASFALSKLKYSNLKYFSKTLFYLLILSLGVAIGLLVVLFIFKESGINVPLAVNLKVALKNMIPSTVVLFMTFSITLIFQKYNFTKINNLKIIITVILLAELLRFGWKNTPFSKSEFVFPKTEITSYLAQNTDQYRIAGGIPLNLFIPFGIPSIEGYDSIYPGVNSLWYSYINSNSPNALSGRYGLVHNFGSPLMDLSSVKYVVDYKKNSLGQIAKDGSLNEGVNEQKYIKVFSEGRIDVYENKEVLPMAFVTNDFIVDDNVNDSIKKLNTSDMVSKRQIILSERPLVELSNQASENKISEFEIGLNEINLQVDVDRSSLLFLSHSYDKGWKAYVNNQQTKIYNADYLYQSIVVPEGKSKIHFVYEPNSFRIGSRISLITLGILVLGLFKVYKKDLS